MASLLSPRCITSGISYTLPQVARPIFPFKFRVRMEASARSAAAADGKDTGGGTELDTVIQYVVLRRDLIATWPLGSVVTQGCHASVAAIWSHKDDPLTLKYCGPSNLDSMHKVTLEVKGEAQIVNLSEKLKSAGIDHKLWIEQPENIPTCLATKPYPKSIVSSFFRKLKLLFVPDLIF